MDQSLGWGMESEVTGRKKTWWIVGGVFAGLVVLYVFGYLATGIWMPRSTVVGGVDVSAMRPEFAVAKIKSEFAAKANDNVVLKRDSTEFTIEPNQIKLRLDAYASVHAAGGNRSLNPVRMIGLLTGGGTHPLVIRDNPTSTNSLLQVIAQELDKPEVEPLITFENRQPVVRQPADGLRVDQDELLAVIKAAYLRTTDPQPIPMQVTKPTVGDEGVQSALAGFAKTALEGPVRLNVSPGNYIIDLQPEVYQSALNLIVHNGALRPVIDPEVLAEPLAKATKKIGSPAKDAQIVIKNNKPVIIDGVPGRGINSEELATKLIGPLALSSTARVLDLEIKDVDPLFSTKDAQDLKIVEKVSTFTTYYPPTTYRDINQGRAAELITGTILKPGEEFSLNQTVGERRPDRGFVKGGVIEGGKFSTSYGGGVSQVATTTYNAAFFAGLEFLQFKAHSIYISRYPMGREATVNWPNVDLRFKNNTPYGILITAKRVPSAGRSRGELTVSMWSTKHWDIKAKQSPQRNWRAPATIESKAPDCQPQLPTSGFDVDVTRIWIQDGKTIRTEKVTTKYNPAARIICVKDEPGE